MTLLLAYFFLALFLSFLCSLLEAVLLSTPASYSSILAKQNSSHGERLERFKENINRPLAAILTLNTFAHTLGAAGVGAQTLELYGESSVAIASGILTLLILVFSEIIPKTIGAKYWNSLARFTTIFLSSIIPIFKYSGILWILQAFTKSIGASKKELFFKREDISTIAEIAKEEGIIGKKDSNFIKNIVKLRNVSVKEIMTPYSVMVTADQNSTINEFYQKNPELVFSRIPILNENKIEAYVLKDLSLIHI